MLYDIAGIIKCQFESGKNCVYEGGASHPLRFLSITLQNTTAAKVLTPVATIAGAMITAGFVLPY